MAVNLSAITNGSVTSFDGGYTILTLESGGSYVLPIPKGVTDLFDNAWDTASFTTAIGKMAAVGATADSASQFADAGAGALASAVKSGLEFFGGAYVDTLQAGTTEEGLNAISLASQQIINPMSQLMYKTPVIRQLQFTWAITPGSPENAKTMFDLIKQLRKDAYPESTGYGSLKYPKKVEIKIITLGGQILLHTLPLGGRQGGGSALSSIQVNYDTEGSPYIHNDGYPVTTTLTLGIQETKMLLRSDIETMYGK